MAVIINKKTYFGLLALSLFYSLAGVEATAEASSTDNCALTNPPADAGETQAHGVILYIYPRTHLITGQYTGCQNQWFLDDDNFRKLSIVHYENGAAHQYDNLKIFGGIGYRCLYENKKPLADNDKRCPAFEKLTIKTFQPGCYSKSKLNSSDSYDVAFKHCKLE